ncbi:MAG: Gfo/Idh/MocA family oxidoreductase [Hydrotalea flava]|nr:Gfo/Idh/MocA family oxidoreductase [Hydrotalea flava]GHU57857.1 hypothetical protein FACS189444_0620 [Spirochaetia bacterium]
MLAPVKKLIFLFCFQCIIIPYILAQKKIDIKNMPVRVVVAGISHGHVAWILNNIHRKDVNVIGIYEPDLQLIKQTIQQYHLDSSLFYTHLGLALDKLKPEAVLAYGSIHDHLKVVQACAPRGIHVMLEKPLATNYKDAVAMQKLAQQFHILLLTNYETSWYPSTEKTFELLKDSNYVGHIRKVVFHDGHQGPKEIGVPKAFFKWLTDPVENGGGAIIDFGCYGANLITRIMHGAQPISIQAVTRQFKPDIYPKVDDDATIIINYPTTQAIIMASWNWPFSRKDMEVYGDTGYIISVNAEKMRFRKNEQEEKEKIITANDIQVFTNPYAYLYAVLRKNITIAPYGLYSLENNLMVVKILDKARESAKLGRTVLY